MLMPPRSTADVLSRAALIAIALAVALLGVLVTPAAARFELGLYDLNRLSGPSASADLALARSFGASTFRHEASWAGVAPPGPTRPAGFRAEDPADPAYRWQPLDAAVRAADAAGVRLFLVVTSAPAWAEGENRPSPTSANPTDRDVRPGAWDPDPVELGAFARALARRYSGSFPDPARPGTALPRVRDWEFWNEQNLPYYFAAPRPVDAFRRLLNTFYDNVKGVHRDNVVSIGGLAPVSFLGRSIRPLQFAAELLCLRRTGTRFVRRRCPTKAKFDVLAAHPYSLAATPTKHAYRYDDLLVADTSKLTALLRSAERLRTISSPERRRPLWVTEWGWFTNPPNTFVGDSPAVAARYTALSLHLMWRAGVSLVVWQGLFEVPGARPPGGALYTVDGRPKATLKAFAFPFFARVRRGRGYAWGKAPAAGRPVAILQRTGGRWRTVGRSRSGPDGIFQVRFPAKRNARFAARVGRTTSIPYDSRPVAPRRTHAFRK